MKKDNEISRSGNEVKTDEKETKAISMDSTIVKDGEPIQEETPEKGLYREEHGDLTNDPT